MSSVRSSFPTAFPISDEELDRQVESFPLAVLASVEGDIHGVMLGSLERIGGTPSILWGLGVVRKGKHASATLKAMTGELTRRAAISFPDEDVLVAARLAAAELLRAAAELRERRAPPGLHAERRGPGVGPAAGEALRQRRPLRRPRVQGRGEGPQAAVPRRCSTRAR